MRISIPHRVLASQLAANTADAIVAIVLAFTLLSDGEGGVASDRLVQVFAAATIPYALAGPISGALADRWPRRGAMAVINLGRASLTLVAIIGVATGMFVLGLVASLGKMSTARLTYHMRAASVPHLVTGERVVKFDADLIAIGSVGAACGAAIAAIGNRMPTGLLVVAGGLQVCAAVGFATLPVSLGGGGGRESLRRAAAEGVRGFRALVGVRHYGVAVTQVMAHRFVLGGLFATVIVTASNTFGLGPKGQVVAYAVTGVGSFLGTRSAARLHRAIGTHGVGVGACLVPAVLIPAALVMMHPVALAVAAASIFFAFQNFRIMVDARVQKGLDDSVAARAFSIYDASYNVVYYAGGVVGALLVGAGVNRFEIAIFAGVYLLATPLVIARSVAAYEPTVARLSSPI